MALYTNTLADQDGVNTLASHDGSAWSWGSGVPSGTVIKETKLASAVGGSGGVGTSSTSYTDTGIAGNFTASLSSSDSFFRYRMLVGMSRINAGNMAAYLDITWGNTTDSTQTTYDGNDALGGGYTYGTFYWDVEDSAYMPLHLEGSIGTNYQTSNNKNSWAAGDSMYLRFFFKINTLTTTFIHENSYYEFSVAEIKK